MNLLRARRHGHKPASPKPTRRAKCDRLAPAWTSGVSVVPWWLLIDLFRIQPPRGIAMTLKPIQGTPIGAPIPDFPTGEPGALVVPESRLTHRPVEPSPFSNPPPTPSLSPAWRPGPVEIRGSGDSTLTFRCIPEIPAIKRSSMTISITGEPTGDYSSRMPQLDLA